MAAYKCKLRDVHHILIGSHQYMAYLVNREIIRYNFVEGEDLWLTVVYNGDLNKVFSGCGENTFIKVDNNSGYAYGALDAMNAGLDFALDGHRDIVVLTNFDCFFFSQKKYRNLIEDFVNSDKPFGAGYLLPHKVPMTDCILFKRDFLKWILPIRPEVNKSRLDTESLQEQYKGSQLGFDNVEEWMLNALMLAGDVEDNWFHMQRDGAPRFRYTDRYAFGHLHEEKELREALNKYEITRGDNINKILDPNHEDLISDQQLANILDQFGLEVQDGEFVKIRDDGATGGQFIQEVVERQVVEGNKNV